MICSFRIVAFILAIGLPGFHAFAQELTLAGRQWNVHIDPATLAVRAQAGEFLIPVSAPLTGVHRVAGLRQDGQQIRWSWTESQAAVRMSLEDDALVVDFTSEAPGHLVWPIIEQTPARAFILPMFEGLYIPSDDPPWARFFMGHGALNTTADLSMPFWGLDFGSFTLTYLLTNPYNNRIEFQTRGQKLGMSLTHEFTANQSVKRFGYRIALGEPSPVAPAKLFRKHLIDSGQFVAMREKIERVPDAAKLLGAPHVYLWGDGLFSRHDFADLKKLAGRIIADKDLSSPSAATRVWRLIDDESRKHLTTLPAKQWVDHYDKRVIAESLSRMLKRRDFFEDRAFAAVVLPDDVKSALKDLARLSNVQAAQLNCRLMYAAFADDLNPVETWGDGYSRKMLKLFHEAGIDRLWLGSPTWDGLRHHPDFVREACQMGYLVAPYDSYHSMHSPDESDTWETAQFGRQLYEIAAVVQADGAKKMGFKRKGYAVNSKVARPYVERRVRELMSQFSCNSWFIDCDAFGELFDDYSPDHPMSQEDDMTERVSRMTWIRDTFRAVVGSEGGSFYAAPAIHFAHGVMTPVIGWGDEEMTKSRDSRYFIGAYYPPDAPAIFFKQVPMKPHFRRIYADPRFRLPLYQVVFHDSVITTHQWGFGSLKFTDDDHARELLELLYCVPPLYHLNRSEWEQRKEQIKRHVDFFSPLHRDTALVGMSDFDWLSDDRLLQRTRFGPKVELIANFSDQPRLASKKTVPPHSVMVLRGNGETTIYCAAAVEPAGISRPVIEESR